MISVTTLYSLNAVLEIAFFVLGCCCNITFTGISYLCQYLMRLFVQEICKLERVMPGLLLTGCTVSCCECHNFIVPSIFLCVQGQGGQVRLPANHRPDTDTQHTHTLTFTRLWPVLELPISMYPCFVECGRKLEDTDRDHTGRGRTCKPHRKAPGLGIDPRTCLLRAKDGWIIGNWTKTHNSLAV